MRGGDNIDDGYDGYDGRVHVSQGSADGRSIVTTRRRGHTAQVLWKSSGRMRSVEAGCAGSECDCDYRDDAFSVRWKECSAVCDSIPIELIVFTTRWVNDVGGVKINDQRSTIITCDMTKENKNKTEGKGSREKEMGAAKCKGKPRSAKGVSRV